MIQAQGAGLGYELRVVPESSNRSDGLGAIRPGGRLNNHEPDLMDHPSDR